MTESEEWFDRYVRDHGHDPGEPEPDLGITKRPDRLIRWNGSEVVCEIKQFDNDPHEGWSGQARSSSMKEVLKPIRRTVSYAAEQLKPLDGRGLPLVVVIGNPNGMPIPLSPDDLIWALYGDPVWKIPIDVGTGGPAGETEFGADRNGQIRNLHQYLSAVLVLRHRENAQDWANELWTRTKREMGIEKVTDYKQPVEIAERVFAEEAEARERGLIPEGDYFYADVFVTASKSAAPLPEDVFDGPRDSRWQFNEEESAYVKVR